MNKNESTIIVVVGLAIAALLLLRPRQSQGSNIFAGIGSLTKSLAGLFGGGGNSPGGGGFSTVTTSTGNTFNQGGTDPVTGLPAMSDFSNPIGPIFEG